MKALNKLFFWRKFGRFLLIGISAFILFFAAQQNASWLVLAQNPIPIPDAPPPPPPACTEESREFPQCGGTCNGVTFPGSNTVLVRETKDSNCNVSFQCQDLGQIEGQCGNVAPVATPVPTAAPSCPDDLRYCDTNVNRIIHKHGGFWDGSQCVYAFDQEEVCNEAAPTPAPARVTVCTGASLTFDELDAALRGANFPGPFDHSQAEVDAFNRAACPAATPTPVPAPQTVTVCTGAVLTFEQLDSALRGANFPGPFDHSQAEVDAFNRAACPAATPTPAPPAPTPTPAPPAPTPTPAPPAGGPNLTCPSGFQLETRDNVTVCVQTVVTNNNANVNANSNDNRSTATATNTNNISFGNVGVAAVPAAVVQPRIVQPQVAGVTVTQLPKTGLSELAWSVLAFIPAGFGMRKFRSLKKTLADDPKFIWEDRKYRSGV